MSNEEKTASNEQFPWTDQTVLQLLGMIKTSTGEQLRNPSEVLNNFKLRYSIPAGIHSFRDGEGDVILKEDKEDYYAWAAKHLSSSNHQVYGINLGYTVWKIGDHVRDHVRDGFIRDFNHAKNDIDGFVWYAKVGRRNGIPDIAEETVDLVNVRNLVAAKPSGQGTINDMPNCNFYVGMHLMGVNKKTWEVQEYIVPDNLSTLPESEFSFHSFKESLDTYLYSNKPVYTEEQMRNATGIM